MTEVNGIGLCSSLAFVGGPDRHEGRRGENGIRNISKAKPGTSQGVSKRGENYRGNDQLPIRVSC